MNYCSDCVGGFTMTRKVNGEKFDSNFRPTTTDMLQINEQICSDNYEIQPPQDKPTLSCGADGQPENLNFQFYEDRKCDGVQDCENGFDESDCGDMPTIEVPTEDDSVQCCKYLRFERQYCHHIELDSNPYGGGVNAWECYDDVAVENEEDGPMFFRLKYGEKDQWHLNLFGKPSTQGITYTYTKLTDIWNKNCPEGGYTNPSNDGYRHLHCVTEDQFKINAPKLYKKFNPDFVIPGKDAGADESGGDSTSEDEDKTAVDGNADEADTNEGDGGTDDGTDSATGTDGGTDSGADGGTDGEDMKPENGGEELDSDQLEKMQKRYELEVGQFLVQLKMDLVLSMKFPDGQEIDEFGRKVLTSFNNLLNTDEYFIFDIKIAQGSDQLTNLELYVDYANPETEPMPDDWKPADLLTSILNAIESIGNEMPEKQSSEVWGTLSHKTSEYLKTIHAGDCEYANDKYQCDVLNGPSIPNDQIELVNFESGMENLNPYRQPTIRILIDIEIEIPKDEYVGKDGQIKQGPLKDHIKTKLYELQSKFEEYNPIKGGITLVECEDDGVYGELKTGSSMLSKSTSRKRRESDPSENMDTIILLIDYVSRPFENPNDYPILSIIDELSSTYNSETKKFPGLEELLFIEVSEVIEKNFELYDTKLTSYFEIEAPSADLTILDVGFEVILQENFSPVQFIEYDQMMHRIHVEVPSTNIFKETPGWLKELEDVIENMDDDNAGDDDDDDNIALLHFMKSRTELQHYIIDTLGFLLPGDSLIDKCKITAVLSAKCLQNNGDTTCIQFGLECIEYNVQGPMTLEDLVNNEIYIEDMQQQLETPTTPEIITIQRQKSESEKTPDGWLISYLYPIDEKSAVLLNNVDELLGEYDKQYWFAGDKDGNEDGDEDDKDETDGGDDGSDGGDDGLDGGDDGSDGGDDGLDGGDDGSDGGDDGSDGGDDGSDGGRRL